MVQQELDPNQEFTALDANRCVVYKLPHTWYKTYHTVMFGIFIKELRGRKRLGLREFCSQHGHDPSNWSKIEREVMAPPRDNGTLRKWAKQLGLKPDSADWHKFFNYAAVDTGRIPKDVLNSTKVETLEKQIPKFFQTLSGHEEPRNKSSAMNYSTWCKAKDLITWSGSLEAQEKLPALVRRLIHGTIENPVLSQFPADEGTRRRGWDGMLTVERGNSWVPKGKSVWEMGVDERTEAKANSDYKKRTESAEPEAKNTSFVFVTPRKWEGKTKWVKAKRAEKKWLDVVVWDCDDLEQWLETAPGVDAWFARLLGKVPPTGVRDLSSYWESLAVTSAPALTPAVFLAGRKPTEQKLRNALAGPPGEIAVNALSLSELRDFFCAVIPNANEETNDAITARAVIVETVDAWNHVATTKNRLILIPSDQLPLEKPMIAEAIKSGHHVLTQLPYTAVRTSTNIRLPRADRWELQTALEEAGFGDERAQRLAREAGGCLSVLVRLGSKYSGQTAPAWSKPNEVEALLPLVLLGGWSDKSDEDRKLVERFTRLQYANIQSLLTRWINQPDAPLRLAERVYSFVSREDSWQLLSPYFTSDHLDRFAEIAAEVLGEDDPSFDMPVNERYLAGVYKKLPKFSSNLREGVAESIALLGVRGNNTPQGTAEGSCWRARRFIEALLQNAPARRWYSLASNLPLLAEAASDEFLSALEADLQKPVPTIIALFEKDADGFFASSPHTNLMWALELLAWDTTHLSRVVFALVSLMKLDTGGRINPRPAGVMNDIFRFWLPQTSATIEERLQVLDLLAKRDPDFAWNLFLDLLPHGHDTAMASYKPRWREYETSQTKQVTDLDITRQAEWVAARLVQIAEARPEKWSLLLEDFSKLPLVAQNATLKWLGEVDITSFSEQARTEVWERVRGLIQRHSFYYNAWWALPKETVKQLADVERKLSPSDPIAKSKWMFDQKGGFEAFGNIDTPYEERERQQAEAQSLGVQEVFDKLGLEGVFALSSDVKFPALWRIGDLLYKSGRLPDWRQILPQKLLSEKENEKLVTLGYAASKQIAEGKAWIEKLPLEQWPPEAVGEFALALGFEKGTWMMIRQRKPDAEPFYWRRACPRGVNLSDEDLDEVIRSLLENDRPLTAIDCLATALHGNKKPQWKLVAEAVDLASITPADAPDTAFNTISIWEICEVMKYLQSDPTADRQQLVRLEWRLLPLARHDHFVPTTLHSELSQNPEFFAEVISAIYRSKNEPEDENNKPDPAKRALWQPAYHLLDSWVGIPGKKSDGTIDQNTLKNWVTEARNQCSANGRIEACDSEIGEVLSYAPADADGSWPCEAVREVFEAVKTDDLLSGFQIGVANQRGVTTRGMRDGGEQERDLVKRYREHAEKCKVGWPHTALALRRIAERYESQANWHDAHADARE